MTPIKTLRLELKKMQDHETLVEKEIDRAQKAVVKFKDERTRIREEIVTIKQALLTLGDTEE